MSIDASRRRFTQGALALGILPALAACGGSDDAPPPEARYGAAVQAAIAKYRLPGVLAGVRTGGRSAWTRAFGLADLAHQTPLSLDSSFPIRSVTKSFTCTLLLQLVREARLTLADPIGRYVAGVPNGDLIQLDDLARMQSGLVDYSATDGFLAIFGADLLHVWTEAELVSFALTVEPPFKPGEQYQYSNTNTVLLGMVIEAVTGQSLAQALQDRIFTPKGLAGTFYPSDAALPTPSPTPYAVDVRDGATDDQPPISPTALAGSGAMVSTLADLLDWGDELGSGSLIGADLQALRESNARVVTNGPEYDRYAVGIGQIGDWWGHTGSGIGFQIATMNQAARGTTISVMVNATPEGSRRDLNFAQEIFQALAAAVEAG